MHPFPASPASTRPKAADSRLRQSLRASLLKLAEAARQTDLPLHVRVRTLAEGALARAYAKVRLRGCNSVGARPSCFGPAWIENKGSIAIGDDVTLGGDRGSVSLSSAPDGSLRIGDRVVVERGSWISAAREVDIGSDVVIGPYCVIADADADTPGAREDATPIAIGPCVRLAAHVVVRPGARIGEGAVIGPASVVEGTIPPHVLASGVPARVVRPVAQAPYTDCKAANDDAPPASERRPRTAKAEVTDACN